MPKLTTNSLVPRPGARARLLAVAIVALAPLAAGIGRPVDAHEDDVPFIFVGSTADGGGALVAEYDFAAPIEVTQSMSPIEGFVFHTADDPSFEPPESEDSEVFVLDAGTVVAVEITALGPSVAMKLSGVELDEVGESAVLGTAPNLHQHPEWQLTLREGETDCQAIEFRITTGSAQYQTSKIYTAYVTNDESSCASPSCGDADGSGKVTVSDGVNVLRAAAGLSSTCTITAVCDVDGNGQIGVTDGVTVLRAAAGLVAELACPDL